MNEFQAEPAAASAAEPTTSVTPEPVEGPPPRRGRSGAWLNVALAGALVLAVGGVAFAAGRMTAPAATFTPGTGFVGRNPAASFTPGENPGGGPGGFFASGGLTVEGTVEAVNADSITVRTASGQTIEIALGEATTYHAQADATANDVSGGETVLVRLDAGAGRGGPDAAGATALDVTVVP